MVLLASDLREVLKSSAEGIKSVTIKLIPGKRPEVDFIGFWTGKDVNVVVNSIAKAYRVARRNIVRPPTTKVESNPTPQNAVVNKGV